MVRMAADLQPVASTSACRVRRLGSPCQFPQEPKLADCSALGSRTMEVEMEPGSETSLMLRIQRTHSIGSMDSIARELVGDSGDWPDDVLNALASKIRSGVRPPPLIVQRSQPGRPLFPRLNVANVKKLGLSFWCSSCVIGQGKLHKTREVAGTVRGAKLAIRLEESTTWEHPRIGWNASNQH